MGEGLKNRELTPEERREETLSRLNSTLATLSAGSPSTTGARMKELGAWRDAIMAGGAKGEEALDAAAYDLGIDDYKKTAEAKLDSADAKIDDSQAVQAQFKVTRAWNKDDPRQADKTRLPVKPTKE
jgi:hypothetical protein